MRALVGASLALPLFALAAGAADFSGVPSFAVREPSDPLALRLSSPALPAWGRTPPLRLIYYATDGVAFNDDDRRTILRELRLIRDFYAHYGLVVRYEDRVYELSGRPPRDRPDEPRGYFFIKDQLARRGLLIPGRTIVFATFDAGLGGALALTGLNDETVRRLECPRPGKGDAWWCGRPRSAHWGGSVHEVGHMLGLSHPSDFTAEKPYAFRDGRRTYVFSAADGPKSVMERHDLFFRHPDNGLLPHDLDRLSGKFRDPGAPPPPGL